MKDFHRDHLQFFRRGPNYKGKSHYSSWYSEESGGGRRDRTDAEQKTEGEIT